MLYHGSQFRMCDDGGNRTEYMFIVVASIFLLFQEYIILKDTLLKSNNWLVSGLIMNRKFPSVCVFFLFSSASLYLCFIYWFDWVWILPSICHNAEKITTTKSTNNIIIRLVCCCLFKSFIIYFESRYFNSVNAKYSASETHINTEPMNRFHFVHDTVFVIQEVMLFPLVGSEHKVKVLTCKNKNKKPNVIQLSTINITIRVLYSNIWWNTSDRMFDRNGNRFFLKPVWICVL